MTTKTNYSKAIQQGLKDAGFNARQVSVKADSCSVHVSVRDGGVHCGVVAFLAYELARANRIPAWVGVYTYGLDDGIIRVDFDAQNCPVDPRVSAN